MGTLERKGSEAEVGVQGTPLRPRVQATTQPDERILIPYGLDASGALVHITEVAASGLACGCTCAECGAPLVAHRGTERVHHFQHHADSACGGGWETALHLLAKDVVSKAGGIGIPDAVAEHGDRFRTVVSARFWRCEAVEAEVPMGELVPDLVLRRASRELLVEFEVTHACDEAKRERIRQRGLACIEVDLSRIARHAPRDEQASAILREAPRAWIHNALVVAAEAELRAEDERYQIAVRRARDRNHGWTANKVTAALAEPARTGHPSWLRSAPHPGLSRCVGVPLEGGLCFSVEPAIWQSALLDFALVRLRSQPFTAWTAIQHLRGLEMIKPDLVRKDWAPGLVELLAERLPGFRVPQEALAEYFEGLLDQGILRRTPKGWRAAQGWSRAAACLDARRK